MVGPVISAKPRHASRNWPTAGSSASCGGRRADGGRVVTHEDITDRQRLSGQLAAQNERLREQEEKLQINNLQLDAALNNMVQGLAMFDADQRIVVANDRYAEMYGLDTRAG